ncbi:sulfotransferase [Pseudotabrizicola alkalilacus]|uniref:Sulfotransferase n=1 Tax=Pseudotabrizicola alkalilacus TaxID=2305252 RepID=A0A411Z5Z7_9RHOB|nr:sulfotransferase [Pseudotabrizicola alkalilacus]RGP38496.1 sulfotransferase [Pseudotabrizicola alkalilacus]
MAETEHGAGRRFVIIGLPRSGTTYLMSLLNSHPEVSCSGEVFNPYSIIETGEADYDTGRLFTRDTAPRYFLKDFFERYEAEPWKRIGFKLMLGHNIRVLTQLPELADMSIIYVHRNNRLAQVASYLKAMQTLNWAQTSRTREMKQKIVATPQLISHQWHEYAAMDFLFASWLRTLPNPSITLEYCDMFKPEFNAQICGFLGVAPDPAMASPLVKQGANRVLDRFEVPEPIEAYIRQLGLADWLENELTE